jgi:DNA (cytosine-5)-methyltransferase 1
MEDVNKFKEWLNLNYSYSEASITDILSRLKRANKILPWFDDVIYLFRLEQDNSYKYLTCSVRSQIKKAVKLYFEFKQSLKNNTL